MQPKAITVYVQTQTTTRYWFRCPCCDYVFNITAAAPSCIVENQRPDFCPSCGENVEYRQDMRPWDEFAKPDKVKET
jgi:rRNA maturation endonuclease Nob1